MPLRLPLVDGPPGSVVVVPSDSVVGVSFASVVVVPSSFEAVVVVVVDLTSSPPSAPQAVNVSARTASRAARPERRRVVEVFMSGLLQSRPVGRATRPAERRRQGGVSHTSGAARVAPRRWAEPA